MKKLALTIAIILGLSISSFAFPNSGLNSGGLFQRGVSDEEYYGSGYFSQYRTEGMLPVLPPHNRDNHEDAPLGSGIVVLLGLGAAYLVGKKHKED